MHFNFHLSGDESPEQSRRIANAVLALGGHSLQIEESDLCIGTPTSAVGEWIGGITPNAESRTVEVEVTDEVEKAARDEYLDGIMDRSEALLTDIPPVPLRYPSYDPATGAPLIPQPMSTNELRDLISSPSVPPVPTASAVAPSGLDAKGLPWDERIHSSSRAINADGTWRYRKNVPDETKQAVEAELRGLVQVEATFSNGNKTIVEVPAEVAVMIPPLPPAPPAPPVPTGALQRTYSDVVNLIMSRKVQPDTYVAILGMSLPEFAKHVISAPNDATLMFDALDAASRP